MSRGISIYYKLISKDCDKVTYGYSGADINKEYEKEQLLEYDGVIEIMLNALISKTPIDALSDNEVKIIRECRYEWHQPRLSHQEGSLGFFAINVISKVFREYQNDKQIVEKGAVVY